MEKANVNGVELEYDVMGSGEPVLLISTGPIADSFVPLVTEEALAGRNSLVTYHQRGQAGSTQSGAAVSFEEHAADAAGLLSYLGFGRAHVAGHSTGGIIALQLAADRSDLVHSMVLMEPLLMHVPSAASFLNKAGPVLAAYGAGNRKQAMERFLSAVSGLDWETCRQAIEEHVPGGVVQATRDADNVFCSYLPALQAWSFDADQAAGIAQLVLSVLGRQTEQLFEDGRELLRSWLPGIENCEIEDAGHLLHMQRPEPVAKGIAEFLDRHPLVEVRRGKRGAS